MTIKMYTTTWCPDCRRAKAFLRQQGLECEEINIEMVADAADWVRSVNQGRCKVPTFEVEGRTFSCSPFRVELLAEQLGLVATNSPPKQP